MIDISTGIGFWIAISLVTGIAATLQSAVGFGFNLLAGPILIVLYDDPAITVPALVLSWFPIGIALVIRNHRDINYRRIAWWIGPALPCALIGVVMLRDLPEETMRRVVGTVTIVSAVLITLKLTKPVKREWPWMLGAGAISGVLAGSTGMSGPPVVLFGVNQGWPTAGFRATLFLYFSFLATFTLSCFAYESMIKQPSLDMAIAAIPGMVFGFFAGSALSKHVSALLFRRIAIFLLIIAGVLPWLI